jgi:hypothetical protein
MKGKGKRFSAEAGNAEDRERLIMAEDEKD